ncbi:MAG TPA: hypothetical protein VGL03_12940 [Thermoanaerobaculia bacterium]|jgi:hypothetical protein
METPRCPEVVRERISRVGSEHLSCALIFDREFSRDEISRFYSMASDDPPAAADFEITGRIIRYDCPEADEAKWRLRVEIFLVKSFRQGPKQRPTEADARSRMGMRPLYR